MSAKPGTFNLDLYRGDWYGWQFRLWSDDEATVPVDLADAVVAAEVRDRSAGAVVVELGVVVTEPNIIDMTLTVDLWADLPAKGVWDLQVTFPGERVKTPLKGSFAAAGDVTGSTP